MDSRKIFKNAGILIPAFIILFFVNVYSGIIEDVKNLRICLKEYCIGEKLLKRNIKKLKKAYNGTERYKDRDIVITVSKKEKIIIGIYKKFDNATFKRFKETISFLMMKFGEPTIEAHGKSIYWFYSKKGKITNEKFIDMKKKNKIEKPLLMIKFHSDTFFSQAKEKKKNINFYYIIYSEPLMKKILKN